VPRRLPTTVAVVLAALALTVSPSHDAAAQIMRDATPVREEPRRDTTPRLPPLDSAARAAQDAFENIRHKQLPHVNPHLLSDCTERIGRTCYWYDDSQPPPERDSVKDARATLLAKLDSLGTIAPRNYWIVGQRVRYLLEADRTDDALAAARACPDDWRCDVLVGLVEHVRGDYVPAGVAFDAALARMDATTRCEWRAMYLVLDPVALGDYRGLACGDPARAAWEERTWFFSRTLFTMPGNDSRTEYFARMTMAWLYSDAATPYRDGFEESAHQLLLKYGWPTGWAAERVLPFDLSVGTRTDGVGDGPMPGAAKGKGKGGTGVGSLPPGTKVPGSVPPLVRPPDMPGGRGLPGILGGAPEIQPQLPKVPGIQIRPRTDDGIKPVPFTKTPAYRYTPPGFILADPTHSDSLGWDPFFPPITARYAPPYARTITGLTHLASIFRRGDSALVVVAYDATDIRKLAGATVQAGVALATSGATPQQFTTVRKNAPLTGSLLLRAPVGALLMSAEVFAPESATVARARHGIGSAPGAPTRVSLSDIMLYKPYEGSPTSAEDAAPHALASDHVRARDKLGVFWEAYGTSRDGERMRVSIVVLREEVNDRGGLLRRLASPLGERRDGSTVSIGVEEVSARGTTTSARGIAVDISTLRPGAYVVKLEIEVAGQAVVQADRRIQVVE
jgi:hypothetical protein